MPKLVSEVLLGRLAIDRAWQGKGLRADLPRDARLGVMSAGEGLQVGQHGAHDTRRG